MINNCAKILLNIKENNTYMKLNNRRTVFVGIAFLSICLFWGIYDNVIPLMLIEDFGLNQFWSGVVMALDNVLALFLLPLFGHFSDRTKTKWGKRTPYIVIGTIAMTLLITGVAIFNASQRAEVALAGLNQVYTIDAIMQGDPSLTIEAATTIKDALIEAQRVSVLENVTMQNTTYIIGFIVMLFFVLVAMATYRTPAVALMPDVTVAPLRSKANAIINLMGTAGGIVAMGLVAVINSDTNYIALFAVTAVVEIVFLVLFVLTVKEPQLVTQMHKDSIAYGLETAEEAKEVEEQGAKIAEEKMPKDVKKSFILILLSVVLWFFAYNAATTKFSYYAKNVLEMSSYSLPLLVAQAAAVVAFIPIGIIASKVGRRKTILVGIILLAVAFLGGSVLTIETKGLIYVVMVIAGIGWATINVNSYPMVVEMSKGGNVGKFTGYYYAASMAAQVLTPMLSGWLMDVTGTARVLFPYSVVFAVLAFVTMFFVKHGDAKPIPTKSIDAFDKMDAD